MKTIKYISLCILLIASAIGCTKDDEMVVYDSKSAVASELSSINSTYELEEEKQNEVMAEFKWTASSFGFSAAVEYMLEADISGEEFKNPVEVFAIKKSLTNDVTQGMMNTALKSLQRSYNFEDGTAQSVEFRIKSSISSSATPLYSNTIMSTITPYQSSAIESLYMIGDQFGGWDWNSSDIAEMIPVNGAEGDFWCVRYFEAGKGFKWAPQREWKDDFNDMATSSGFYTDGGNAFVENDGMYIVYISTGRDQMVIEPAQIYGMGDAFGSWDEGAHPFAINGDKATITVAAKPEEGVRMYATCSIAQGAWWTREFIVLDGIIAYRGNGGDQERVMVNPGQVITLDFNAGTGTIQ